MHLLSAYCIPSPSSGAGGTEVSITPVIPALPLKGACGQEQQCLLEETVVLRPVAVCVAGGGNGQDGICLYDTGEGWAVARLLVLGLEGLFPSGKGLLGRALEV